MKEKYVRQIIKITEFDVEDVIMTSGVVPTTPDPEDPIGIGGGGDGPSEWF